MGHNTKLALNIGIGLFLCLMFIGGGAKVVESAHDKALNTLESVHERTKECSEWRQDYPYKGRLSCYANGDKKFEYKTW